MKPFRGKPEKPKRSNGEIHRRRRSGYRWRAMLRMVPFSMVPLARARRHRIEHSGVVVVHFSPCRTSRPVACRSTAREGACRVAFRRTRQTLGRPAGCATVHQRYRAATKSIRFIECVRVCVHPAASSVSSYPGRYGPSAVPGPGQLLAVRCPRTGQTFEITGRRRYCFGYSQDPS